MLHVRMYITAVFNFITRLLGLFEFNLPDLDLANATFFQLK